MHLNYINNVDTSWNMLCISNTINPHYYISVFYKKMTIYIYIYLYTLFIFMLTKLYTYLFFPFFFYRKIDNDDPLIPFIKDFEDSNK